MSNKAILASLAMDLKRVSLGLQRKSFVMADRFSQEALQRKSEIDASTVKPYMRKILENLDSVLSQRDVDRKAEATLMYSTLIGNYAAK
ncbi:hypothetical protein HY086_05805 [Candidatus Gottesmanbacteria bacterium]|nr:hypothetical protein [Candidatus Gottesmanbacteria bacterium]